MKPFSERQTDSIFALVFTGLVLAIVLMLAFTLEAPHSQKQAGKDQHSAADIANPVAGTESNPNTSEDREHPARSNANYLNLALAVIGAAGVFIALRTLTVIERQVTATEVAANAAKQSADIANESLLTLHRPFVYVDHFKRNQRWDDGPEGKPTNIWYRVTLVLKNSGTTPTRDMRLVIEPSLRSEPLPIGFTFTYSEAPGPIDIGPQGVRDAPTVAISAVDLSAVKNGTRYFYFWGDGVYADMFSPAELIHKVSFCFSIRNVLGDPLNPRTPLNPSGTDVDYEVFTHPEHNSTDDAKREHQSK